MDIVMSMKKKPKPMIKKEEERKADIKKLVGRYYGLLFQKNSMESLKEKTKQHRENEKKVIIQELLIIKNLNNAKKEDMKVAEETAKEIYEETKKYLLIRKVLKDLPNALLLGGVLFGTFVLAFEVPLNSMTAYLIGAASIVAAGILKYWDIDLELFNTAEYKALEKTYHDIIGKLVELKRE